jgi:MOSC domain-containing protein YiiM
MVHVEEVRAVAGKGLEGDRYFRAAGTYSAVPEPGRQVTLVEIEAIEAVERDYGIELAPRETRRNVITRGVRLNELIDREFRVGEALLRGIELCEPCTHMAQLAGKNVVRGLVHRGGLRADIVADGLIRVGDPIEAL